MIAADVSKYVPVDRPSKNVVWPNSVTAALYR